MADRPHRVLVIGRRGLGGELARQLATDYDVYIGARWSTDELADRPKTVYVDVLDDETVRTALTQVRPETVIIGAALTGVQFCESHPFETVRTNVGGVDRICRIAVENRQTIRRVVLLSSCSAVNPTNVYGQAMAIAEATIRSFAETVGNDGPRFVAVRFGNLITTPKGVIQTLTTKAKTDPTCAFFQLTDPRITRYWMTPEQVAMIVRDAITNSATGDVWIPTVATPARISDIVGVIADHFGVPIRESGPRVGDKLHDSFVDGSIDRTRIRRTSIGFAVSLTSNGNVIDPDDWIFSSSLAVSPMPAGLATAIRRFISS